VTGGQEAAACQHPGWPLAAHPQDTGQLAGRVPTEPLHGADFFQGKQSTQG